MSVGVCCRPLVYCFCSFCFFRAPHCCARKGRNEVKRLYLRRIATQEEGTEKNVTVNLCLDLGSLHTTQLVRL